MQHPSGCLGGGPFTLPRRSPFPAGSTGAYEPSDQTSPLATSGPARTVRLALRARITGEPQLALSGRLHRVRRGDDRVDEQVPDGVGLLERHGVRRARVFDSLL